VLQEVARSIELIRGAWSDHAKDFGYRADQQSMIERHLRTVPLLHQQG
jgi:hypothetical protein